MLKGILNNEATGVLKNALGASALKHKVIAHNIANINTPGFKSSSVSFEKELSAAIASNESSLARTDKKHLPPSGNLLNVSPTIKKMDHLTMRNDGNNVDIDSEMTNLAENTINYQVLTRLVAGKYEGLRFAINEGRR